MFLPIFGVVAALTVSTPPPARVPRTRATHRIPANDLYAARARRRMASYLRLRLLELRMAGLRRAADAVERRLPIGSILEPGR
jgi:hypothetical protein